MHVFACRYEGSPFTKKLSKFPKKSNKRNEMKEEHLIICRRASCVHCYCDARLQGADLCMDTLLPRRVGV